MGWGTGNIGSGSGGLNFKIVGGTSEPSNPRENTIWVNTDEKITSWVFSAEEPEAPSEGMVWFTIGTSSTVKFNALKKNGLQVYPISAKQYISGAWVDKAAKSYQNGAWVDWWNGELYKNGNTYDDITGGWGTKSAGVNSNYPSTGAVPTVAYNSTSATISIATSKSGLWYTKNKIHLSGKTKLSVQLSNVTSVDNSQAYLQIRTDVSGYVSGHSEIVGSASFIDGAVTENSATIDLSSLSLPNDQTYYVCIGVYSGVSFDVNEIKLS